MPIPYPNMSFTPMDTLMASELNQIVANIEAMIDLDHPVGSYFETSDPNFDPNVAWGGTWVEDTAGRVTVARTTASGSTFATVGATGGEEKHTLTIAEMPRHRHYSGARWSTDAGAGYVYGSNGTGSGEAYDNVTGFEGGGAAHNNLQPYVVVKRWHRTA